MYELEVKRRAAVEGAGGEGRLIASGLNVDKCRVMSSKKLPLWLSFKNADDPSKSLTVCLWLRWRRGGELVIQNGDCSRPSARAAAPPDRLSPGLWLQKIPK